MKITDEKALKELKTVRSYELEWLLQEFPQDEVDDRSDLQMVADELSYMLDCYAEDGNARHEALNKAYMIKCRTKNFTTIPLDGNLKPIYREIEIQFSKGIINEHRRLESLQKRLNAMGIYGQWNFGR